MENHEDKGTGACEKLKCGCFNLKEGWRERESNYCFQGLHWIIQRTEPDFPEVHSDRARGNRHKLQ